MALLCLCGAAPRVTWQQYRLYHLIRFLPKRAGECTPECGRARCIWAVVHNKISRGQCCYTTPTAKERRKPWSDNATLKIIFKIHCHCLIASNVLGGFSHRAMILEASFWKHNFSLSPVTLNKSHSWGVRASRVEQLILPHPSHSSHKLSIYGFVLTVHIYTQTVCGQHHSPRGAQQPCFVFIKGRLNSSKQFCQIHLFLWLVQFQVAPAL